MTFSEFASWYYHEQNVPHGTMMRWFPGQLLNLLTTNESFETCLFDILKEKSYKYFPNAEMYTYDLS